MATPRPEALERSNIKPEDWYAAASGAKRAKALRQANADWFAVLPFQFNVAVALHMPNAFRAERGRSERVFQRTLRHFFTRLDRKVHGSAAAKRGAKIPRFVVLENSPSLGWHMHALLSAEDTRYTAEQLCTTVKLMWLDEFAATTLKGFEPYLGWAQPLTGGYANYMGKDLYGPQATAVFDEINSVFEPAGA